MSFVEHVLSKRAERETSVTHRQLPSPSGPTEARAWSKKAKGQGHTQTHALILMEETSNAPTIPTDKESIR